MVGGVWWCLVVIVEYYIFYFSFEFVFSIEYFKGSVFILAHGIFSTVFIFDIKDCENTFGVDV